MTFYVQRRYKYWVAEKPEKLLAKIHKKEEDMREALPALSAIRKSHWGKKRTNKDTSASIGLFRIFADTTPQPMLIANEQVEIVYVNEAWEKQFGYLLEEVRGQNPRMLQSGLTPRSVYERMWKALTIEKMFQSDEIIDKRKDGTHFTLLTTIFLVSHEGNQYYIQMLNDISDRKCADELRETLVHTLESS